VVNPTTRTAFVSRRRELAFLQERRGRSVRGRRARHREDPTAAGRVALAKAVLAAGAIDLAGAEPRFEGAVAAFRQFSLPWDKAEARYWWGRALLATHEQDAASEKLQAAQEPYVRHGAGSAWLERVRGVEVLRLSAAGHSNQEIAPALVISRNTVERHVNHIFVKTGAANRTRAAGYAHRHGLA
jgi:DNA-binding CsgD family transcriptional regulator